MRCKPALWLFVATLFVYAYFFQGHGFNQNAHFDTVRALVEKHSFEITGYASATPGFTGDVSTANGRLYSSKPPGLALCCAPFYAVVYSIERLASIDCNAPRVVWANQWLTTIWGAALPSALLVIAIFRALLSLPMGEGTALTLAAAFAFGSLFFPYAGMLTLHALVTLCLFTAWQFQRRGHFSGHVVTGLLLGLALLSDTSAAPPILAFVLVSFLQNRRHLIPLLIGPALAVAATLLYQKLLFGGAGELPTSRVNVEYHDKTLFLGHFDWPDLRRLWWLSFHPLRGLFYTNPLFILALLSVRPARPKLSWLIPTAIVLNFLLFNLTFHAWTAGWGTGPRYLMPILPFLLLASVPAYQRFPKIAALLITISTVAMFAVAAERLQWGSNLYGPPKGDHPVSESIKRLIMRQVALDKDISNVGLQLGLRGVWSLIPPALVILATFFFALKEKINHEVTKDTKPSINA